MTSNLSQRDRAILRAEVADKIEELLPSATDALGGSWRARFARLAREQRIYANGCFSGSEAQSEHLGWACAYEFILDEVQS